MFQGLAQFYGKYNEITELYHLIKSITKFETYCGLTVGMTTNHLPSGKIVCDRCLEKRNLISEE
jgi:hypothetical protein